uniref:Uncharacterized protein n=1 Tax=Avena sativa TaxID=4498 RepID=A0ACD5TUR8_AVESA
MALEAVVFAQGHFGYGRESPYTLAPWCDAVGAAAGSGDIFTDWDLLPNAEDQWEPLSSWDQSEVSTESKAAAPEPMAAAGRRKRRRTKVAKNKEEVESQRRTHIAVERNRRRQMNEYLAELRSIMPSSYAQRGDQASIVGGAINYVKELEQLLQALEVEKSVKNRSGSTDAGRSPFASFFTFPQYSTSCNSMDTSGSSGSSGANANGSNVTKSETAVADIEVTMVEGHASLRVLARRRPRQLQKLVAGMQQLRIPPLHLNMTTVDAMVLYSFSLKVI